VSGVQRRRTGHELVGVAARHFLYFFLGVLSPVTLRNTLRKAFESF